MSRSYFIQALEFMHVGVVQPAEGMGLPKGRSWAQVLRAASSSEAQCTERESLCTRRLPLF